MKRAAIISLTIPEVPGKSGGEIRDIYLFKYIGETYKTDYFSIHNFWGEGEINQDFASMFEHIYYPCLINEQYHDLISDKVHMSYFEKVRYRLSLKGVFLPGQRLPAEMLGFRNEFNRYIRVFFEKCSNELEYDYVFISPQVNPAIIEELNLPEKTKVIWATYDVERIRHTRLLETRIGWLKKFFYQFEIAAACRYEKMAVEKSDGIIAVSELDRRAFVKFYHIRNGRVLSIENGVDVDYFYAMPFIKNYNVTFVGNMGYAPNEQAAIHFIREVFPKIIDKYPEAHFYVVGTGASEKLRKYECRNVIITGRVEDVREYIANAHVVCVPLLTGSGTKYKVLEAMACERAVVTTLIGAEGLDVSDKESILIAKTDEDMMKYINELFTNEERCREIGRKARAFILRYHAWNVILPKMNRWMENL